MHDNSLHRLIPEWHSDEATRLNLRNKLRWNGIIEEIGDGWDVDGEAGKHGMIIMFYNDENGG